VNGERDSQRLAEMSRGLLRNKIPQLQRALEGRVTAHHRFLLRELLDHLYFVESKMRRIEQKIEERLGPFQSEVARLCTIPGVDRVTAWAASRDRAEHESIPGCATLSKLGGTLSG
jgi:transposase